MLLFVAVPSASLRAQSPILDVNAATTQLVAASATAESEQLAARARDYLLRGAPADEPSAWLSLALCKYYQRDARFRPCMANKNAGKNSTAASTQITSPTAAARPKLTMPRLIDSISAR